MPELEAIKNVGRIPYDPEAFQVFSDKLRRDTEKYLSGGHVLYGRVAAELENEKDIIQISLITDEMINRDKAFINRVEGGHQHEEDVPLELSDEIKGYHPYFMEFYTNRVYSPDAASLRELKDKWVKVRLRPIKRKKIKVEENSVVVRGNLIFGTSPATQQPMEAEITNVVVDCDISTDTMWNALQQANDTNAVERIKAAWFNTMHSMQKLRCRIYNVGQGNCVSLLLDGATEVYFDIGHSNRYYYRKKDDKEKELISNFRHILSFSTPKWVVLSHWHMDHVNGYDCLNENGCGFNNPDYNIYSHCFWIAPHLKLLKKKPSDRVIRFAYYALTNRTLWMVDRGERERPVMSSSCNSGDVMLWQGTLQGKEEESGVVANDTGLLLQICNRTESDSSQYALLPGDCAYEHFPASIKNELFYQLLITPHHGSAHTVPDLQADKRTDIPAQAVLSVGRNSYGHPAPEHMGALLENGFRLDFTLGCCYLETEIVFGQRMRALERVSL